MTILQVFLYFQNYSSDGRIIKGAVRHLTIILRVNWSIFLVCQIGACDCVNIHRNLSLFFYSYIFFTQDLWTAALGVRGTRDLLLRHKQLHEPSSASQSNLVGNSERFFHLYQTYVDDKLLRPHINSDDSRLISKPTLYKTLDSSMISHY